MSGIFTQAEREKFKEMLAPKSVQIARKMITKITDSEKFRAKVEADRVRLGLI